jgi:hypothetical protein
MPYTHYRSHPPPLELNEPPDVELVISYYAESMPELKFVIDQFTFSFAEWTKRVTVYHKGIEPNDTELEEWVNQRALEGRVDKVVGRENVGRDGGTYLWHM